MNEAMIYLFLMPLVVLIAALVTPPLATWLEARVEARRPPAE